MNIAIIAHDGKKAEMVNFIAERRAFFERGDVKIMSTGTTGQHVQNAGFKVKRFKSGPLGGDAQIASRIVEGKVDIVMFFRDPLGKHPHDPDIFMLMRLCDVHNIPIATNPATANLLLDGL